jgi:nucleotide-binding universal stress UspA family protein
VSDAPILICYDGSVGAKRAIAAAASLLGPRKAVVLDLGPILTPQESLGALAPGLPAAGIEESNEDEALTRATEGAKLAAEAGFDATPHAAIGAPVWQGIVELADALDAAAIVIGSRGLTAGEELLAGSVSHQVSQHAGRPVLLVPPARD